MRYFCTLFNKSYQYHAQSLYSSILKNHQEFKLFLFCMDDDSYDYFFKLSLEKAQLVRVDQLEASFPELLEAKGNRRMVEYFFTCTPAVCNYVFKHFEYVDELVYLDADIYFFDSPETIFDEIGESSISIIAHRFKGLNWIRNVYGYYNVGWISFKRDGEGIKCLKEWFRNCLEWCFDKLTLKRFADQKYLNRWPTDYKNVCIIKNVGANAAPWNIGNYKVKRGKGKILLNGSPLIFYHFAGLKKINNAFYTTCSTYLNFLRGIVKRDIYCFYLRELFKNGYTPNVNLRYKKNGVRPFLRTLFKDKILEEEIHKRKKVSFVYKFLPQYRRDFFYQLKEALDKYDTELNLIYGKSVNRDSLKKDEVEIDWAQFIPNKSFRFGKIQLIWQPCTKQIKTADLIIVQPENKLLLNYYLIIRRLFSKSKFAFWGHGRNMQANVESWRNKLKSLYINRCDWWFAYTSGVKNLVAKSHFPEKKITVVQNAIDTIDLNDHYEKIGDGEVKDLKRILDISSSEIGIFCGGMYPEKRIDFIIDSCIKIKRDIPDFHMLFLGAGVDSVRVIRASENYNWIHYIGPKFGRERVIYFKLAALQLMPGLVGLGILDSFALETPIVTTSYPFHSPEIEYLENGFNGLMTKNDLNLYSDTVVDLFKSGKYLDLIKGCKVSAQKYTLETMVKNFKTGILECLGE